MTERPEGDRRRRLPLFATGLSARLLLLAIFFVMLSEVLIYVPSVSRYRIAYMEERIASARLASLALVAPVGDRIGAGLQEALLKGAGSYGVAVRGPDSRVLALSDDMPPKVSATYDLRRTAFFPAIAEALSVLWRNERRYVRVVGAAPGALVETVIDEWAMRDEMLGFSGRILALSVFLSVTVSVLIYAALQVMFVRPILGLTDAMARFRRDPDDARNLTRPGRRRDETGRAQSELAEMQRQVRAALGHRARLAALGTAVAKINHDLRNALATARLVADRVSASKDPDVHKVAPTLLGAIDRAAALCTRTLDFANEGAAMPDLVHLELDALVSEVATGIAAGGLRGGLVENAVPRGFSVFADREQMHRVLSNLMRNAFQAGAVKVSVVARVEDETALVEIADDGPGLPEKAREDLFKPFHGTTSEGGSGLGLAIARDLMLGHGGGIALSRTGPEGTVFVLRLPAPEVEGRGRPADGAGNGRARPADATR